MPALPPKFVPPGAGAVLHGPDGSTTIPKLSPRDTGDALSVDDYFLPPGGGPPLHVHQREDETFFVLEGTVTFWVDGQRVEAAPGAVVFGPRGVPHTFRNLSNVRARMLLLVTPPSNFAAFYAKMGAPRPDGSAPDPAEIIDRIRRLSPEHGIEVLGPNPL